MIKLIKINNIILIKFKTFLLNITFINDIIIKLPLVKKFIKIQKKFIIYFRVKKNSLAGNRTRIIYVKGIDTNRCTTKDHMYILINSKLFY